MRYHCIQLSFMEEVGRIVGTPNFDGFETFEELLSFGRMQLTNTQNGIKDANVTGIEDQLSGKYLDQMIELNQYMYTTYSTNRYTDCLSIGGELKLPTALKLANKCKEKGFWYAINDAGKVIDHFVDDLRIFNERYLITSNNPFDRPPNIMAKTIDEFNLGQGWFWFEDHNCWAFSNSVHYFFPSSRWINGCEEPRNESRYYGKKHLYQGDDRLVKMEIEDPGISAGRQVLHGDNLYLDLIQIFRQL
jgi:hypothetical protein